MVDEDIDVGVVEVSRSILATQLTDTASPKIIDRDPFRNIFQTKAERGVPTYRVEMTRMRSDQRTSPLEKRE